MTKYLIPMCNVNTLLFTLQEKLRLKREWLKEGAIQHERGTHIRRETCLKNGHEHTHAQTREHTCTHTHTHTKNTSVHGYILLKIIPVKVFF
jgi:ABC-type Zn2+ transport system substrate-binding protein/surface adhesin